MAENGPMSKGIAIGLYLKKVREKTKGGSYQLIEMNYDGSDEEDKEEKPDKKESVKDMKEEVKSSLCPKVQDLIRLIFDMKMMANQMK